MTNSDNTFGTHNKITQILSQVDDGSTAFTNHADVAAAKSFFLTTAALTVFDECCTELQWAAVDNTKLKYTMTFGTKGTSDINASDDWGGQYASRITALVDAGTLANNPFSEAESSEHLF